MASGLDDELAAELAAWEERGLARSTEDADAGGGGADLVSNDVLGLARHPAVVEAARRALEAHGAGGRAARLLGGGSPEQARAEEACARWLGAEAALLVPSGWHANLGLVGALAGPRDVVLSDALCHASLVDAARLSRARVVVHRHLDLDELERGLARARAARRRLVVTEAVFSMDGDAAPLDALHALCERHDAWLVVDEAHAVGLLGPEGAGAARHLADAPRLVARVATGGKALGVAGALVCGSRALRSVLLQRARTFVFTTAPPPAVAAALAAAIEVARGADDARERALDLARLTAERLGLPRPAAAIVPVVVGDAGRASEAAAALQARGLDVRAVRPPTVPEGSARLRLVLHATSSEAEVDDLVRGLADAGVEPRAPEPPPPAERAPALVVVGTDTGIGKTVVAAALCRAARRRGPVRYWKPVQTGDDDDTATVAALAGLAPEEALRPAWSLPLPASPHEAAADAGVAIDPARIEQGLVALRRLVPEALHVVELAGGLLVPYRGGAAAATQADWLASSRLACVLVARSGLGTLNHTLLTLEALRARHLEPRALVLVGPPHPSNRATLAELGDVPLVLELPPLDPLDGAALERWIDAHEDALAEALGR